MCDTSGPNTGSIISLNAIGKQDTYLIENDQTKSFLKIKVKDILILQNFIKVLLLINHPMLQQIGRLIKMLA